MATVPGPAPVHLLSSSPQSLLIHTHPVTVHHPFPQPDPKPLNPTSVPNLHSPSSDLPPPSAPPPPLPLPTPHPPQPCPASVPLSSAAACAISNPIPPFSSVSIFAPSSSSAFPPLLGTRASFPSPSADSPSSTLDLSSATASTASTSLSISQAPSSTVPRSASSTVLASTSALPALPLPLLPAPPPHTPPAPHIPQAQPSSNLTSLSVPASSKPSSASMHHQPSFAQVARGPRGPGFVRSHASNIEPFARLPRTGINIISGSREGLPSFSFVNSELPRVEGLFSQALVMKFHGGRPSLESSHKEILSWGIDQPFSIGPLSSRSFLLRFQAEKDLLKVLSRPSNTLLSYPYRVFRWHSLCHLREDSCLAPVWISLPRLPLQCFIPEFLESVANSIGRFLCLDKATATLARPSAARLCVELDLRKPPPQFIWIGLCDGVKQQIIYERLPKYCNGCNIQGHTSLECSKGSLDTPHITADTQNQAPIGGTPHVRTNAYNKRNSANLYNSTPIPSSINNHSSTTLEHLNKSNAEPYPPPAPQELCEASVGSITPENANPNPEGVAATNLQVALRPSSSRQQFNPADHHLKPPKQSARKQSIAQKQKSVSITPQQSNVEANQVHWEAIHRQVSVLEQARLSAPAVDINPPAAPNSSCQAMIAVQNTSFQEASLDNRQIQPNRHPLPQHISTQPVRPIGTANPNPHKASPTNQHDTQANPNPPNSLPNPPNDTQLLPAKPSPSNFPNTTASNLEAHQPSPLPTPLLQLPNTNPATSKNTQPSHAQTIPTVAPSHNQTSPPPHNPSPDLLPTCALCLAHGHTAAVCPSGQREAAPKLTDSDSTSIHGCTPPARQNALKASSSASTHQNASKSIKLKKLDVDQSPLLNQQQQDALERFKQKVRAQTQNQDQQLIGSTSANPFDALIEDQSDEEDEDYTAASFNSDTDDGFVEPIDMGYQSADGRSSHNHSKSSAPVMKTNKRHPNIPLNVRLRTRKNSYSSSHKYLCM